MRKVFSRQSGFHAADLVRRLQSGVEFTVCGLPISIKERIFTVAVRTLHSSSKNLDMNPPLGEVLSIYGHNFQNVVSDLDLDSRPPPRLNV